MMAQRMDAPDTPMSLPMGTREAYEECARTCDDLCDDLKSKADTNALRQTRIVEGAIAAYEEAAKAIRSRLSALPESGGAATKPIASDDEHAVALARVEELMDARAGTPDGDELSALVDRVEAYEDKRWPIDAPSPDAQALNEIARKESRGERNTMIDLIVDGPSPESPDALAQERAGVTREDIAHALAVNDVLGGEVTEAELNEPKNDNEIACAFLRRSIVLRTVERMRDADVVLAALRTRAKEKTDD